VVFVLETFARRNNSGHQLATMSALAVATFMGGVVVFGLGYLLNRIGRSTGNSAPTTNR
jgi:hypothetical protein